ncbi:MAG: adenylyl-sulfate kinase [Pseudomonadota bacterium]|nr:adenylyl-sulfate kinase [Pseudomonadota bacterium]
MASSDVVWHAAEVSKQSRAALKQQRPCIIWFTGLSGSGKSTIANALEEHLAAAGQHTYLLDGDNVRHGLNQDLGFTDEDRVENIRRVGEVAALFVDAGLIVIAAFISPFRSERELVRNLVDSDEFIEVYMSTPLATCEERDPKGLYGRARAGLIRNFTGIDSAYQPPETADLVLDTSSDDVQSCVSRLLTVLTERGILPPAAGISQS